MMLAIMVPVFYAVPDSAKVVSMAASYSVAYWLIFIVATWMLSRRLGGLEVAATVRSLLVVALAGAVGALVTLAAVNGMAQLVPEAGRWGLLVNLVVGAALGTVGFVIAAWVLRIREVREVGGLLRSRLPGGRPA